MLEDRLLLLRFKHGRADALERIYRKYRSFLLRVACGLLSDVAAAEDAVHDTFLRFARSPEKVSLGGSLKAYLATCVLNAARDEARRAKRRPNGDSETLAYVADHSPEPDQWLILNERSAVIFRALGQLPEDQREAVSLRLLGDIPFRRIAAMSGVPTATVRSRFRYGLIKLRSTLNGKEFR